MGDFKSFLRQLSEGNYEGVRQNLDIEFVDKITDKFMRTRPIHIACVNGNTEIVKLLIENNCDIELEDADKWRPIHYACRYGYADIVKLLLQRDCDTQAANINDKRPVDISRQYGHPHCVRLIEEVMQSRQVFAYIRKDDRVRFEELYGPSTLVTQEYQTGLSVLEVALDSEARGVIELLMEKKIDEAEIEYLRNMEDYLKNEAAIQLYRECLFCRSIAHQHLDVFDRFCLASVINGVHKLISTSFLEIAAQHRHLLFVSEILKKSIYNKELWDRAMTLADHENQRSIFECIKRRESLVVSRANSNFSALHMAVSDNDSDMLQYLLEQKIVDSNINHPVFGTALALAHSLHHDTCIEVLERFHVDPNTQNRFSQTPLHEAIISGTKCRYLIEKCDHIDRQGFNHLTALHTAVLARRPDLCQQLLDRGADCTLSVDFSCESLLRDSALADSSRVLPLTVKENALTLCLKVNGTMFPCFLQRLDKDTANGCDGLSNSLLHLAALSLQPDLCKSLIEAGASLEEENAEGNNCLMDLLLRIDKSRGNDNMDQMIGVVKVLVEREAGLVASNKMGQTVLHAATRFNNERLLLSLVSTWPTKMSISENDYKEAFLKHWFAYGERLTNMLPKESVPLITRDIIDVCVSCKKNNLVRCLFEKASCTVRQSVLEDLLYYAANNDEKDLFEYLIKTDVHTPKMFDNGENLFTCLLTERMTEYCYRIIRSNNIRQYVDLRNRNNRSSLELAIEMGEMNIVDNLIGESSHLNIEGSDGSTVMMLLLEKISVCNDIATEQNLLRTIKSMISSGADVLMMTSRNKVVLDSCTRQSVKEHIERFCTAQRNRLEASVTERMSEGDKKVCNVCLDNEVDCVLECGHTFCMACGNRVERCPLCLREPTNPRRIFL